MEEQIVTRQRRDFRGQGSLEVISFERVIENRALMCCHSSDVQDLITLGMQLSNFYRLHPQGWCPLSKSLW